MGTHNLFKNALRSRGVVNGLWMYLLQAFNTILPLITLPYVTRILGADGYGYFSIAFNIIGYFQVAIDYGFDMSATRRLATSEDHKATLRKSFSSVLIARMLIFSACCLISIPYCSWSGPFSLQCCSLLVMLFSAFGSSLQQTWVFQGMQDMKYISIVNIIGRVISTTLVFVFVRSSSDILLYCLLYSITPVVSGLFGIFLTKVKYGVHFHFCTASEIIAEFRDGFFVFTTQLSSKVFSSIGVTILGIMASPNVVGVYSALQKIPHVVTLAWAPISQVLYPISSRHMKYGYAEGTRFVSGKKRFFLSIFGGLAVLLALVSKPLVLLLFGSEYADYSFWVIPLLAWLVVAIYNNFLGIQTLLASGHDREYSKCFQLSVIATIVLNLLLIYLFGGTGAAFAPLLSELVLAFTLKRSVTSLEHNECQVYK